jgi:hypothetical protein
MISKAASSLMTESVKACKARTNSATMNGSRVINVFLLLICVGVGGSMLLSCSGKKPEQVSDQGTVPQQTVTVETKTVDNKTSQSTDAAPHIENPIVLPGIEAGTNEVLVVYKDTRFGILESQGYDTTVYRFHLLPGGWIDGAMVYRRDLTGEVPIARYDFSRAGKETLISKSTADKSTVQATFDVEPEKIAITGDVTRVLTLNGKNTLQISPGDDSYVEEYRRGDQQYSGSVTIARNGVIERDAKWTSKSGTQFLLKEQAEDGFTVEFWLDSAKDETRFRTDNMEGINEVYSKRLASILEGEHGFENFALIDYVLGGSINNMRPAMALLLLSGANGH